MNTVRRLRIDKGLSPRALGVKAGVSHETIRQIESGAAEPQAATLKKLADALDVTPTDLLADLTQDRTKAPAA